MSQTLNLFDLPSNDEPWTPPAPSAPTAPPTTHLPLEHPYARYGLAVALRAAELPNEGASEVELSRALVQVIEEGMERFRMRTDDVPSSSEQLLEFREISLAQLRKDTNLVQSAGLAARGIYIFPSVVTTDGGAKGTWDNAEATLKRLQSGEKLDASLKFSRSFAPTTAKINNGTGSQTEPKGSLLEVACCLVTTLTPLKAAAWPGQNVVVVPDLPLNELRDFLELFEDMSESELDGNLMTAKPRNSGTKTKPKWEFRRPRLHGGNYPFAPRDAGVFGAVGLLAAIGRWALRAQNVDQNWARGVLASLAEAPLYLVSYDKISHVRFGSHIVALAMEGELARMLDALWQTRLYADAGEPMVRRDTPAYQLFFLQTSRFLQSFSRPAFADFLASRAEYPALCRTLLDSFFAHIMISKPIVDSARALGQHLNRTAYFVADAEVEDKSDARRGKVDKAKAKILVEFESAIMSAKSPVDMLHRVSTRAGRLLQQDLPAEAAAFMDAAATEEQLPFADAQYLLVAYLRLRSPQQERKQKPASTDSENTDTASTDAPVLTEPSV